MSDIRQNRIELNEVHIARSMAIFLVVLLHSSGAFLCSLEIIGGLLIYTVLFQGSV